MIRVQVNGAAAGGRDLAIYPVRSSATARARDYVMHACVTVTVQYEVQVHVLLHARHACVGCPSRASRGGEVQRGVHALLPRGEGAGRGGLPRRAARRGARPARGRPGDPSPGRTVPAEKPLQSVRCPDMHDCTI